MVSWRYAFRRGVVAWLWTILWGIIGAVVAIVISGGSIVSLMMNPVQTGYSYGTWIGTVVGIFAGAIIGGLITTIGAYATLVKVVLESIPEHKHGIS